MQERPLAGKIAIVTGAGSSIGLGRAMTLALVRDGARVAMVDIDREELGRSVADAQQLGGTDSVLPIMGDVTKPDDAERVVQTTIAELGGLHILVNNAGINPRFEAQPGAPAFSQITPAAWIQTMAVNLNGPFLMAHAAVGHLLAQGWGRIIGVTTSFDTMIRAAPYGPSKAGHEALVAIMARELEGTGVTANILIPGAAASTHMVDRTRPGLLAPEIMQAPVAWLASEAANGFHGRRVIAQFWDEELPLAERIARASAPVAWPQLGRPESAS